MWYSLLLCTSDKPAAGTDADVFVTIHGAKGSSPRIKLPSSPEDFLRGNQDTFRMELKALGDVVRLSVGHNNKGRHPGWYLDHAELTDEASGELLSKIPCASTSFVQSYRQASTHSAVQSGHLIA